MVTVSPLTLYESNKESPPLIVEWECSFAFASNEYRLTRGCTCGTLLVAHFGFKQPQAVKKVAGYMICPECAKNWYYEIPLSFVFKEIDVQ